MAEETTVEDTLRRMHANSWNPQIREQAERRSLEDRVAALERTDDTDTTDEETT